MERGLPAFGIPLFSPPMWQQLILVMILKLAEIAGHVEVCVVKNVADLIPADGWQWVVVYDERVSPKCRLLQRFQHSGYATLCGTIYNAVQ